jgi:ABC-type sugar transport system ATPase subunit
MSDVDLIGVGKSFGALQVIRDVSLKVKAGELVVFVGPSGCGKSTLLRLICGLETLSRGDILIDGQSMRNVDASRRGVAMVFQTYALYPHMTVAENMAFPLRMSGVSRAERLEKARQAAEILQLGDYLDRKPAALSGGQRQRVAIGRAIVRHPKVFLFDEPLSNLDAELRVQMRLEIMSLHRQLGATTIYVTHDQVEAMTMADRIVVLRKGAVEQVGTPIELFTRPANTFIAGFIGSPRMNLLKATVRSSGRGIAGLEVAGIGGVVPVPAPDGHLKAGDTVTLGLRPEHFRVVPEGRTRAAIRFIERLGTSSLLHAPDFPSGALVIEIRGIDLLDMGEVSLEPDLAQALLFDADGQLLKT